MSLICTVLRYFRSLIAHFILTWILGWRFKRDIMTYDAYRTGRFIAVYLHTSLYDQLVGVLFSYALNLRFITIGAYRSNKDTQTTGIRYLLYNLFDTIVVDPHKDRTTTCKSIIHDLKTRDDFIFSIYPEGSIYRTSGLKSGFYMIAQKTKSTILMFDLDYHTHELDLRSIIDQNVVLTAPSRRILEITTEELVKTVPFDATRTYLLNAVHSFPTDNDEETSADFELFANSTNKVSSEIENTILHRGKETSLIDINRSILRFIPLLTVSTIGISIVLKLFVY
jgi:hypothetical protein